MINIRVHTYCSLIPPKISRSITIKNKWVLHKQFFINFSKFVIRTEEQIDNKLLLNACNKKMLGEIRSKIKNIYQFIKQ